MVAIRVATMVPKLTVPFGNKGTTNMAPPHPGVSPKREPIIGCAFFDSSIFLLIFLSAYSLYNQIVVKQLQQIQ